MRDGAREALCRGRRRLPADVEQSCACPGAFEMPQAARASAETGRFDAVVCLGCLIRGETPHFEYISAAVAHGSDAAAGETGVPMAFGVLTTDTWEQAMSAPAPGRTTRGARPRPPRSRWRALVRRSSTALASAAMTAASEDVTRAGRRRAREAALQMLYQWEVGRGAGDRRSRPIWPRAMADDAGARRTSCASSPTALVARHRSSGSTTSTRCIAEHAQNWRVERMAVLDRLVLRLAVYELLARPGHAARRSSSTRPRAGAARSAATRR